ncbi:IS200/IS605 family transposase [Solitalea canadensis]|uniref:Transposase n=1 Tax=Solitalea canadensis (strain ATCC 29591 / DSM 3403 / JCM 21819 / LMG 8368 / NBRC 15130 / NCIMB 12057 / USAM 9D) TaxID=929556 RepID=H8KUH7_SOLCM|nr:IS200/IS605 family transposase [Solitalea canadensis]AFD07342.1 transposase [Solitalea canadensis DSM 3403]
MSHVKIWVHLVFSTKNRIPFLKRNIRFELRLHIMENCKKNNIFLQAINGYEDHLHCLISIGKDQTISKIAHMIKGESAFWLNKSRMLNDFFSWQDDYFAVSVSESQLSKVINYIHNQEKHPYLKIFCSGG